MKSYNVIVGTTYESVNLKSGLFGHLLCMSGEKTFKLLQPQLVLPSILNFLIHFHLLDGDYVVNKVRVT